MKKKQKEILEKIISPIIPPAHLRYLLCRHFRIPFYVFAAKSKFVNKKRHETIEESYDKIWKYVHPNLTTINIPFEEIDKRLIRKIISE